MWTKKQAKCVHTDLVWTKKHVHPTSKFTDFNETAAVLHRLKCCAARFHVASPTNIWHLTNCHRHSAS